MVRAALVSLLLGLLLLGTNAQEECTPLVEAAQEAGLTTLIAAIQAANLVEAVTAEDAELTVFAPTNDAFDAALKALDVTLPDLVANTELLTEILLYHVLPTPLTAEDLSSGGPFTTVLGDASSCGVSDVTVEVENGEVTIVGAETQAVVQIADVETCMGIVHVIDFVLLPCPLAPPEPEPTLVPTPVEDCTPLDVAANEAGLTTLLAALQAAGLVEAVTDVEATLTVFAPTNEAFDAALNALGLTLEDLVANTELLTEILLYHALPEAFVAEDFGDGGTFTTVLGDASSCGVSDLDVVVTDTVKVVGGVTEATVSIADVVTCSGVVHVIDFVLLPCPLGVVDEETPPMEGPDTTSTRPEPTPVQTGEKDVVTAATEAGLTTLVALVKEAGLVEPINAGGLTIFAPTNEAFEAALKSLGVTADALIANKDLLREILTYHVLPDAFTAEGFGNGGEFETVLGDRSSCGVGSVKIAVNGGVTIFGGVTKASVIAADVKVGTTVVHVIDNVLLPCQLGVVSTRPSRRLPQKKYYYKRGYFIVHG